MKVKLLLSHIEELYKLALRRHYDCEDEFYACPKANREHFDVELPCTCGADNHNNKVNELYAEILDSIGS